MNKDCSTCICKEGSYYPSVTIFDKDKTCKSYAPDYEGYITELEKEKQGLKDYCDKYVKTICSLRQNVAELEKENAELKKEIKKWQGKYTYKCRIESYLETQLTKAKDILTKILQRIPSFQAKSFKDLSLLNALSEAEQFLSEVEK